MSNDLKDAVRIAWRDGQVLASRDLRAGLDNEARQRRQHNRYLHSTWGVALGFSVTLLPDLSHAIVSPGYAIDIQGRDLLLAETLMVAPPVDGMFILSAMFDASFDASNSCRPALAAADFCPGLDPRRDRALVAWISGTDFNMGLHVPLARAVFAQGKVTGDLDMHVRRYARRMVRPHIGSGMTEAGATNWIDASVPKFPALWLQAEVDTSAAGFIRTPRYITALVRKSPARKQPRKGSLNETAEAFGSEPALSLDGIGSITKATPNKFTYRVPRGTLPFGVDLKASEAKEDGWVVAWVGFETVEGFQPQLNLAAIITVLGNIP